MSKQDKLFKDAIITAAASASTEIAEELLSYFVAIGNRECFAALLYVCFDLLRSDVVMELSWQHGLNDFYVPYQIQNQRTLVEKVCDFLLCIPGTLGSCTLAYIVGYAREGCQRALKAGHSKRPAGGRCTYHQPWWIREHITADAGRVSLANLSLYSLCLNGGLDLTGWAAHRQSTETEQGCRYVHFLSHLPQLRL